MLREFSEPTRLSKWSGSSVQPRGKIITNKVIAVCSSQSVKNAVKYVCSRGFNGGPAEFWQSCKGMDVWLCLWHVEASCVWLRRVWWWGCWQASLQSAAAAVSWAAASATTTHCVVTALCATATCNATTTLCAATTKYIATSAYSGATPAHGITWQSQFSAPSSSLSAAAAGCSAWQPPAAAACRSSDANTSYHPPPSTTSGSVLSSWAVSHVLLPTISLSHSRQIFL